LRSTDGVLKQADTLVVLAEVLQAAGRPDESGAAAAEALGLYEAKGNVVAAARVRASLAALSGRASAARV
ncbi:MAG TPA: hypothetical protein VGQ15_10340, partial [Gaiellaceae bacterium]|nr:hypothetical protein [Gaiellaceae bacterium]